MKKHLWFKSFWLLKQVLFWHRKENFIPIIILFDTNEWIIGLWYCNLGSISRGGAPSPLSVLPETVHRSFINSAEWGMAKKAEVCQWALIQGWSWTFRQQHSEKKCGFFFTQTIDPLLKVGGSVGTDDGDNAFVFHKLISKYSAHWVNDVSTYCCDDCSSEEEGTSQIPVTGVIGRISDRIHSGIHRVHWMLEGQVETH